MRKLTINNKVIFDRKYHKKELFHIEYDDDIDVWSLGGKIDGISTNINNNTTKILEIKNRVNKLFKCVRNYEKVQCYAYMFLLDIPVIDLAETLKSPRFDSVEVRLPMLLESNL